MNGIRKSTKPSTSSRGKTAKKRRHLINFSEAIEMVDVAVAQLQSWQLEIDNLPLEQFLRLAIVYEHLKKQLEAKRLKGGTGTYSELMDEYLSAHSISDSGLCRAKRCHEIIESRYIKNNQKTLLRLIQ